MVVRCREDPDDVGLRHDTVTGCDSSSGRGDLTLQKRDNLVERLVVSLEDECLGSFVRNTPECRDRLGHAEGEVVARDGTSRAGRDLVVRDRDRGLAPPLVAEVTREIGYPVRHPSRYPVVLQKPPAQRFASHGIPTCAEQQGELLGRHLAPRLISPLPSAWSPEPCHPPGGVPPFGAVPRKRGRSAHIAIPADHAPEQVVVAPARRHHAHCNSHRVTPPWHAGAESAPQVGRTAGCPLGRRPTEPTSFCKRCMSKWGEDGRRASDTYKMQGGSGRNVRDEG